MEHLGLISTVFSDDEAFLYSDDQHAYYANIRSINGMRSSKNKLRSLVGKYITYKVLPNDNVTSDISISIKVTSKLKRAGKILGSAFR